MLLVTMIVKKMYLAHTTELFAKNVIYFYNDECISI